jgi:hypothetical protein
MTSELLLSIKRLSTRCLFVCPSIMTSAQSTAALSATAGEGWWCALGSCRSDEGAAGQDTCAREDLSAAVAVAATTAAAEIVAFECLLERGRPAAAEAVAEAVQCALQCALEQRCVAIVALLLSRRASLSQVSLPGLFTCASVSDATSAALTTSAYLGVPHDAAQLLRERPLELSRRPMPDVRGGRASFSFVECMHKLAMAPSSSGTREDVRPLVGVAGAVV